MSPRARNRVLIHSNSPTVATGYGVQTRHLATMLAADGYDVAVSCTYGQAGRIGSWTAPTGDEIRLYPQGWENNSPDILVGHAEHWFEGDPDAGIIILLCDAWTLLRPELCETLHQYHVVAWTPVDHRPCPPLVRRFIEASHATPVAMSRYGLGELQSTGLEVGYVPLAVDMDTYQPTPTYQVGDRVVDCRSLFDIPTDAYVVGMCAMNKDPHDRKGFGEALQAFAQFHQNHPEAVLYLHTEPFGALGGYDIPKVAAAAGIPPHALIFPNGYAYRVGFPPEMMAAMFTAFDVMIAPSRGEGFCVPLIEAQACGVPVVASNYTAQPELVSEFGWLVDGQEVWDPTQSAYYQTANVDHLVEVLEEAYVTESPVAELREFVADYDYRRVYVNHWQPLLATFEAPPPVEKPVMEAVDVVVPLMRPDRLEKLLASIDDDRARTVIVHDTTGAPPLGAIDLNRDTVVATGRDATTYAEKVNLALQHSDADWVLVIGDDVEFLPGWFDAAADISASFDIIGTNDSEPGRRRNLDVAAGRHADHFFIRRDYIDDQGSSLDGPGVAMPTAYRHWYVDREVIQLARARGVFGFAENSRIVHHHPGYDGDEDARQADPVYMAAVTASDGDEKTWRTRAPLIEQHRVLR